MYLISVYFDENTNRILQKMIDQIAKETGNTFMIDHKVPPHMTIMAIEAKSIEVLMPAFENLSTKLAAGDIEIVSTGQLWPNVIYEAPVLNKYLQNIISTVYEAYKDMDETSINKFYKPNSWLPHITLAKTLSSDQMLKAFEVTQRNFRVFDAKVIEIGLSKVNPHEDVMRFAL